MAHRSVLDDRNSLLDAFGIGRRRVRVATYSLLMMVSSLATLDGCAGKKRDFGSNPLEGAAAGPATEGTADDPGVDPAGELGAGASPSLDAEGETLPGLEAPAESDLGAASTPAAEDTCGDACSGECEPGQTECTSPTERRECGIDALWGDPVACASVCVDGSCAGECAPGTTECVTTTRIRECSELGTWSEPVDCEFACIGSACGGVCQPGQTQCASTTGVQVCTEQGEWGPTTACQNACAGNACTGECVPGATRCSSETQLQTCNEQGQFLGGTTCPFACVNGACGGECSPGTRRCNPANGVPQFCSSAGLWQSQAPCQFVCSGSGTCGGECSPGSRRCNPFSGVPQLCSPAGAWQNDAAGPCANGCNPGTGLCNNLIPRGGTGCSQSAQCAGAGSSCQGGRCCEFDCNAAGRFCTQDGTCQCQQGTTPVGNECLLVNGQDCDPDRIGQCASGRCNRWFRDGDGDLHGDPNQPRGVCGNANSPPPTGYVASDDDCCDTDADANPDQTVRQTVANACGNFDYNCDDVVSNTGQENIGRTACQQIPLSECNPPGTGSDIVWTANGRPPACGAAGTFTACSPVSLISQLPLDECSGITGGTTTNTCI